MREKATAAHARAAFLARGRWRAWEALPWIVAVLAFFVFPAHMAIGTQVLIGILFTLSLDLILGYAGIVTLGHAAYFGAGAYAAGVLSAHWGWNEPLTGLVASGVVAAALGLLSGLVLLRYHGLALIMLTLAFAIMLQEATNVGEAWTGGYDGLLGISIDPILGHFENDLWSRHYYWYALIVLFLCFLAARRIVHSPFGANLMGIRENLPRMRAIGSPVYGRLVVIYTISAGMAGIAGGLFAQSNAFVTLEVLSFARSGTVLIMLILGGTGKLYGAIVGAAAYMLFEHRLAKLDPVFWEFGVGLALVLAVLFFRSGILGALESLVGRGARLAHWAARRRPSQGEVQ